MESWDGGSWCRKQGLMTLAVTAGDCQGQKLKVNARGWGKRGELQFSCPLPDTGVA